MDKVKSQLSEIQVTNAIDVYSPLFFTNEYPYHDIISFRSGKIQSDGYTAFVIENYSKPFAEFRNITPKTNAAWHIDWTATNVVMEVYHEPIVTHTNNHWEIRFKE
jgi:hypothetical protein